MSSPALKFVRDLLKDSIGLKKKDREKIQREAEHIIQLASADDVDKYVAAPRKKHIDYMMMSAGKRRGRPAMKKSKAKAVPKLVHRIIYKKAASKEKK